MIRLDLSSREVAYLVGCVSGILLRPGLSPDHRQQLLVLLSRLAPLINLEDELAHVFDRSRAEVVQ